jgi:hypothetical protein
MRFIAPFIFLLEPIAMMSIFEIAFASTGYWQQSAV